MAFRQTKRCVHEHPKDGRRCEKDNAHKGMCVVSTGPYKRYWNPHWKAKEKM